MTAATAASETNAPSTGEREGERLVTTRMVTAKPGQIAVTVYSVEELSGSARASRSIRRMIAG